MTEHWTTTDVKALLQKTYGGGERHAVFFEVRDSTGFSASRSIDAVTMSLWPSLGLELSGMEIKVSRGDWLRELKNPAKASRTFEYFDYWYLVAPTSVAHPEEIPTPWGWLAPAGNKLVRMKVAPKNKKPKPIDRKFLAALLRCKAKGDDYMIDAAVSAAVDAARKDLQEQHKQRVQRDVDRMTREMTDDALAYRKIVREVGDHGWVDSEEIVRAIKMVMGSNILSVHGGMANLQKELTRAAKRIEDSIAKMENKA